MACFPHHWILADDIVPLPTLELEMENSNCWGRTAVCQKCGQTKIMPEYLWSPPGNNRRGRGRKPRRTGSHIARRLQELAAAESEGRGLA